MDVEEIITSVKNTFGDESGVQISDEDIIRWINAAQHDVVLHNESVMEEEVTVNLIKDQQTYAFPTDLLVLRSIRVQSSGTQAYIRISPYSLQEFDKYVNGWDNSLQHTGQPSIYTTYEQKIFLFPTPSADAENGLKILYSKKPTVVTQASGPLSLPLLYHNAIVDYCLSRAHAMDEDYEASTIHRAQYKEDVRILSFREQEGAREYYPTITVMPEDW
jgi:hypothetical protein